MPQTIEFYTPKAVYAVASAHANTAISPVVPDAYQERLQPWSYLLSREIVSGWKLDVPLRVNVEQTDEGSLLVSEDVFLIYGSGVTFGRGTARLRRVPG